MKRNNSIVRTLSVYDCVRNAVYNSVTSQDGSTPPYNQQYIIVTLNGFSFRKGIRNSILVTDKTLTATGFSGTENVDWENIISTNLI